MSKNGPTIEKRLAQAKIAISNALTDPTLRAALEVYGYTTGRLQQGNTLREQVRTFCERQKNEYGELFAANDALKAAQQQAKDTHMRYVKVARVALMDDRGASQKLGLTTHRKQSRAGWVAQAHQFYTHALSDTAILDRLAEFGITQVVLKAGQHQVEAVSEQEATRQQRQGAARDATRARDEMIAALDKWMKNFTKIARVAFEGRPQLLEQLGIKAHAPRAARTPAAAAPSEVAFVADAPTLAHESPPPAPERRNGRATVTSR